jgi:GT2 family glycosyltransferase
MIGTVVVSYKRPDLLRRTLESYLATVTGPHRLLVVDNGSSDEALEVTADLKVKTVELGENRFPGYATNVGWDELMSPAKRPTYLHRSDNDVEYLPGWCDVVREQFEADDNLGQLGLRTVEEEGAHPNVGGNCVIASQVFDRVRWAEEVWMRGHRGEDYWYTTLVATAGLHWKRVETPCIVHLGTGNPETDPYYVETWTAKGYGGF